MNNILASQVDEFYADEVVTCVSAKRSRIRLKKLYKGVLSGKVKFVVFDTETTGLDPFSGTTNYFNKYTEKITTIKGVKVFMFQFGYVCPKDGKFYIIWIDAEDHEYVLICKKILLVKTLIIIGHNLKFDYQVCKMDGAPILAEPWDTLAATRLTHDRLPSHTLKFLGNFFSGKLGRNESDRWEKKVKSWLTKSKTAHTKEMNKYYKEEYHRSPSRLELEKIKEYYNYSFVPNEIMVEYALKDIWYTYLIFILIHEEIENNYSQPFNMEIGIIKLLMTMELRGLKVDRKKCMVAYNRLQTRVRILNQRIDRGSRDIGWFGFNPNSHLQMKKYLIEYLKVPARLMTEKDKLSSGKDILTALCEEHGYGDSMLGDIMELRGCNKLKNTYFETIIFKSMGTNILHPNIKPSDTKTGRAACANPNLHNIPRPDTIKVKNIPSVRSTFIPRKGYTNFYFDYSQVEMVVFALFSQIKGMLKAVDKGEDLHLATAIMMFKGKIDLSDPKSIKKYRQLAKSINFGIVYGMGIVLLSKELKISLIEAKKLMNLYYKKFPGIKALQLLCKKLLYEQGYVEDMFGRRYHLPMDKAYVAVNSITQGGAANILKLAMLQVEKLIKYLKLEKQVIILMTIHDELVIEFKKGVNFTIPLLVKFAMEDISPIKQYGISPTVDIEFSTAHWESKEKYKYTRKEYDNAYQKYCGIRKHVVINYDLPLVDWFLQRN